MVVERATSACKLQGKHHPIAATQAKSLEMQGLLVRASWCQIVVDSLSNKIKIDVEI